MQNIELFIFDLDGVIVDTAHYHFLAWRRLAREFDYELTEKQNEKLKGVSRVRSLEHLLEWGNASVSKDIFEDMLVRKNEWYLQYVSNMDASEILPGVLPFIDQARIQGIKIALGSASKNAGLILEKLGITDRFDAIIDGTKTTRSKPDPQVFELACAATGVAPEKAIVFEDAPKGIDAAKAGKMWAVGVGASGELAHADFRIMGFEGLTPDIIIEKTTKAIL